MRLVAISPGLGLAIRDWEPLLQRLAAEPGWGPDTTEFLRHESNTSPLSLRRLASVADDLAARINARWIDAKGYSEIILIGHSLGGLVVRQAFLAGRGAVASASGPQPWANAVTRIVLLASPNRGVARLRWYARPLDWLIQRLPLPTFTYEDLKRGSAFVTNLRIAWIRLFLSGAADAPLPEVIQLLGTVDSTVNENDSVDVLACPNTTYVKVAAASHENIHRFDGLSASDAADRYALLRAAVVDPSRLQPATPAALAEREAPASRVVFVLHGIRASQIDHWLLKVENEARALFPVDIVIKRPSYGYFTAIRFALPTVRRRNIRKFQDVYTEVIARHPHVLPDFIGHSNGTYMLGQSLLDVPAMRFGNVVLAGSVLPEDYPWDEKARNQVGRVRSERGQRDWPVGWLCKVLRHVFFMRDVGTGGYSSFERGEVVQEKYHGGKQGHGAMFTDQNIPRMVRFALGGDPGPELPTQVPELAWWSLVSRLLVWIVPLLLLALAIGAFVMFGGLKGLAILAGATLLLYIVLDVL
ncbi:MAG TPA: alpha/beta fold hydrolase [Opitutaceae bacterium]|nr:alpha/beta fold hydrolase [Opitutaceae bacterium]